MPPPSARTSPAACARNRSELAPFHCGFARREVHADVAGADRAEDRVGQRVEPDIGVGMADDAGARAGSRRRTPSDMVAGAERMHVEALADPDVPVPRREQPLGGGEVVRVVTFRFSSLPATMSGAMPGRLGDRGIVGQRLAGGGPVRGEDRRRNESPAASARARGPPRSTVSRMAVAVDPLDRVAERQGRDRRRRASSASMTRSIIAASGNGRAPSWISTRVRLMRAPALRGRAAPNPAVRRRPGPAATGRARRVAAS